MGRYEAYVALTGLTVGVFCEACLAKVEAANDHLWLEVEDSDEPCWACEAIAAGCGSWA